MRDAGHSSCCPPTAPFRAYRNLARRPTLSMLSGCGWFDSLKCIPGTCPAASSVPCFFEPPNRYVHDGRGAWPSVSQVADG